MLTEKNHAAEYLLSEANGNRSREAITVISGEVLKAGHVLGAVFAGTATGAAFAGNAGSTGTIGAVTVTGPAKRGVYKVVMLEPGTDAGKFSVEDPDGVIVGTGTVAVAFSGGGLAFTIADGGTDFIAGEGFNITVVETGVTYKEYDPTNTDGSQVAVGVLFEAVDATLGALPGVMTARDAEIKADMLTWFSGANDAQKAVGLAQLAAKGIIARS